MSTTNKITSHRFELKKLLVLMLPILITQFSQAGLGLIDTIMSGHLSPTDLALYQNQFPIPLPESAKAVRGACPLSWVLA